MLELHELGNGSDGDVLDRPFGIQGRALSGGERQRIALGRALARRPSVVILTSRRRRSMAPAKRGFSPASGNACRR
ncbi:hypothetical protein WL05_00465 [Burkholderia ubonensis]|nr:ATP-binding cassette domain-containing protein [Burkholderia ubonensis]KVM10141.1 hypothetical protein WJ51_19050 [Burkholderia ubonensis]KVM12911.1 hypothetical protein WJ52_18710 [Burkholderia ubonensis]KVM49940.1 hypothetical protein WJ56_15285 [Burkholderia ubonensis]KVO30656.1 hypothetical protein WJ74_22515 [Burkholderia ubonensis]KVO44187.1 hypothetical protein WJ76_02070 [Burkholderia ubonensis]